MDICVLNPMFHPYAGGTEKVLLQIYGRLSRRHNITVISSALANGGKARIDRVGDIKVVRLRTRYSGIRGLPLPFMQVEGLAEQIAKESPDIYHINNRFVYYQSALNAMRSTGGKIALTIHNSLPRNIDLHTDIGGLAYDALWGRRIMAAADVITGVSKNAIDVTVPGRMLHKAHVIFNGVDFNLFRPMARDDPEVAATAERLGLGCTTVLANGRLTLQKGHPFLLRAFAGMAKGEGREMSLLIVGRGPMEHRMRRLAARLGVGDALKIVSNIPESQLPMYYNASDVFVMPSLYEPAGITLLEALSCELPSTAARVGGIPEMMKGCGTYFNPRSAAEIRRRMESILADTGRAKSLARRGRRLAIREHNWDKIAVQYEKLFLDTVER